jgi:hypothetical protein
MEELVLGVIAGIAQKLFAGFATWIVRLMAGLQANALHYADGQATHTVLQIVIPVALALLLLRMLYGVGHDFMLWDSAGTNIAPTQIVKGAALAGAGMAISSLLVKSVWDFFAGISLAIAGFGVFGNGASLLNGAIGAVIAAESGMGGIMFILVLFEYGAALIILMIVVIQTFVRIADLALYLVTGPIAAVGLVSRNQGAWAGWWKGLIVLAGSQTAQLFLVYLGFSAMAGMGFVSVHGGAAHITVSTMITAPLMLVGALLASLKGADFVKQMGGYSTGVGGLAAQHGSTIASNWMKKS